MADKLKDLERQFGRELDGFFDAKAGRAVSLDEVEDLKREFKAEHLPRGQEAIVMAKRSGLMRPRKEKGSEQVVLGPGQTSAVLNQAIIKAGLAKDGYNGFTFYWIPRKRSTWADVLAIDPVAVRQAFVIPQDADPAQTVAMLCERLVARAFELEFNTEKLEARVEDYRAMVRKRGYHAVLDAADKPGVSLSDLRASADKALQPPRPTLDELGSWHETHFDTTMEGAEPAQAIEAADAVVRESQIGDLDV